MVRLLRRQYQIKKSAGKVRLYISSCLRRCSRSFDERGKGGTHKLYDQSPLGEAEGQRVIKNGRGISKYLLNPAGMFFAGLLLGIVSRIFDICTENLGNIFSQMAIWILFGVLISIYSTSKVRAMANVLLFCVGMLKPIILRHLSQTAFIRRRLSWGGRHLLCFLRYLRILPG